MDQKTLARAQETLKTVVDRLQYWLRLVCQDDGRGVWVHEQDTHGIRIRTLYIRSFMDNAGYRDTVGSLIWEWGRIIDCCGTGSGFSFQTTVSLQRLLDHCEKLSSILVEPNKDLECAFTRSMSKLARINDWSKDGDVWVTSDILQDLHKAANFLSSLKHTRAHDWVNTTRALQVHFEQYMMIIDWKTDSVKITGEVVGQIQELFERLVELLECP